MSREVSRFRSGLAACALLIGSIIAWIWYHYEPEPPLIDGSTATVVPGIHLLGGLGPSAAYVIETSQGVVMIDSGLESDARPVRKALIELQIDVANLNSIFLTHAHGDHCGGAAYLRSATGAKIYAGQGDVQVLQEGSSHDAFFSTFYMPNHRPHSTSIDVELHGGERFTFGDVRIDAIATPGHTPGSICYLVENRGKRILFSGDVIMNYTEKPLGTYSTYLAPRYRGDARDYLRTLRELRSMPVPDLILPGHPSANSGARSPRFTASKWTAMLDTGVHDMERLLKRFEADGANFLDGQPKRLLHNVYYFGEFHGVAVYGFISQSNFFVVNAPGGAGLQEFLSAGLKQLGLPPEQPFAVLVTACDERETAGLRELTEQTGVRVIAARAGIEDLRQHCAPETEFIPAEELSNQELFKVTTISLDGVGTAPVAYLIHLSGKQVLFPGRFVRIIDQITVAELQKDLASQHGNIQRFLNSVKRFVNYHPDLFLPTTPHNGQLANLYDSSWDELLEKNYKAISR